MKIAAIAPRSTGAFAHRDFRLYWTAQLISLMGTFMQSVALGYLVYDLTGSKWLLGAITALQLGPSLLFALPAGVLADRVPRKRLVLVTQSTALALAFSLATLTALHRLQVWEILTISTISGIAIAVESPARQAFIVELVGREDLANAIGWNSLVVSGSRVLGPAVGGIAIRAVGIAPIFYYNSFSFLAMIVALMLMHLPGRVTSSGRPWEDLREGLAYLRADRGIIVILALLTLVATFIVNFAVLMPVIAHDVLHTGAEGLGWMWTAFGLGGVAGSATVVTWSRAAVRGQMLLVTGAVAGLATLAMAPITVLAGSLLALMVIGWGTGAFLAGANSAIQHRVTDAVRGRILSVYTMIFTGTGLLGGLFAAGVASAGGVALTLAVEGIITLAGVLLLLPAANRYLLRVEDA